MHFLKILLGKKEFAKAIEEKQVAEQVNTTACKRLFSLGCVAHTDGAVFQMYTATYWAQSLNYMHALKLTQCERPRLPVPLVR